MSISKKVLILIAATVMATASVSTALAQQAVVISKENIFTGTAVVWDDQSLSDAITYHMENVPPPTIGTELVGWLVADDGKAKLNTGVMTIDDDGTVDHVFDSSNRRYTRENLIVNYDKVVITEEGVGADPDAPAGPAVYNHLIPAPAMAHIRHLLAEWPPGSGVGILTNLQLQLEVAIRHANLAINSTSLENVQLHAQHVINIIEGDDGPNFDAGAGQPGDGLGVLLHAADRKHGGFAAGVAADDEVIAAHTAEVERIGALAEERAIMARDRALEVVGASREDIARIFLGPGAKTVVSHLEVGLNGSQVAGTAESGAVGAYSEAQLMATYTLELGGPAGDGLGGGPGVGDASIPLMAQMALAAALVLLASGGLLVFRGRQSRVRG